jgi:hypothetical protein
MVGVTGSIPVVPTIFFKGLAALRPTGEKMISTNLPRDPSWAHSLSMNFAMAVIAGASDVERVEWESEAKPIEPPVTPMVTLVTPALSQSPRFIP